MALSASLFAAARRVLRRQPGVCAVVVVTMALTIGANTAIFSLLDSLLLRPLPVGDPGSLVVLRWSARSFPKFSGAASYGDCGDAGGGQFSGCSFTEPFFRSLQAQPGALAGVTALSGTDNYTLGGHGTASEIYTRGVAGNYFQMLGVRPAAGRLFAPADDRPSAPLTLVLSWNLWQRAFGGSPDAIGATVTLNRKPVTIVGVAPKNFGGITPGSILDGWTTLATMINVDPNMSGGPRGAYLVLFGRLRPGVMPARAQAEVSARWRAAMLAASPPLSSAQDQPAVALLPAQTGLAGSRTKYAPSLELLLWVSGAILLLACANVAGLLLARAQRRGRELALRRALGASSPRLLGDLLGESLLLAALGGAAGLALALGAARALRAFLLSGALHPPALPLALDGRVLAFTAAATLLTGLVAGLAPALAAGRTDLATALKRDSPAAIFPTRRWRWLHAGNALVVVQLALALVVLAGAGLLLRTLTNLESIPAGFDAHNLLQFDIDASAAGYQGQATLDLYARMRRRLGALPGVENVTYGDNSFLSNTWSKEPVTIGARHAAPLAMSVGPAFFTTLRIPLLLGRSFQPDDFHPARPRTPAGPPLASGPPTAAIVNQAFARAYYPAANPLGQSFGNAYAHYVIIGVVANAKNQNLRTAFEPMFYTPSNHSYANFQLRTAGPPLALLAAVRRTVGHIDLNLPLTDVTTQRQTIARLLFRERLLARLAGLFAALALLLAALGLYALLAQEVTRRTREVGIRLALGARPGQVLDMMLRLAAALAAAGLALGLAGAWALTRGLRSELFGVRPADPATLAAVAALLVVAALAAAWFPARRAARADPLAALRAE